MRRLLSILLLLATALPFCSPLLALGEDTESRVPMCCRRNGAHHCQMSEMSGADAAGVVVDQSGARVQRPAVRCPYCPVVVAAGYAHALGAPTTAKAIYAGVVSHPAVRVQTECRRRVARERARGKRGPPKMLNS